MEVFQRIREWLVLILIIGLPFHAFLVTVGTRVFVGPGHVPLPWLAGWKEATLALVLLLALIEVVQSEKFKIPVQGLRPLRAEWQNSKFKIDILDLLILGLFVLSVLVPILNSPTFAEASTGRQFSIFNFALGAKYTLFPLLLFLILRRVPWSQQFSIFNFQFSIFIGVVVAGYGIFTLFLSESFFTWFGYSDLHSLYLPDGPLAAFQKIEGTGIRRMQSTFSGPNQLGMWLLIPWSVALSVLVRKAPHPNPLPMGEGKIFLGFLALVGIALFLTFSRAAWVGAAVIVGVLLTIHYKLLTRWKLLGYCVIGFLGVAVIGTVLFPELLLRTASSREHWRRPMEAIRIIAAHPLGLGLGSAGPASNRASDPCVFLEGGADISWAKDRPNLCVFVGEKQVQPIGRACACPFLPENWYLQVGVELGIIGLLVFTILVALVIQKIIFNFQFSIFNYSTPLSFIGISMAALFLHAWEDSAVAYTVWILLAGALPLSRQRNPH